MPASAGIRRLWSKRPTNPTMPCASGSKHGGPCETYHHNNRRRPTDHAPITGVGERAAPRQDK